MLILSLYFSPFEIRKPGILTWTHPELGSVVTVAKKRLFSLSHCQTMVPACSSNSKRYNTHSLLGELSVSSSCLLWMPFFTSQSVLLSLGLPYPRSHRGCNVLLFMNQLKCFCFCPQEKTVFYVIEMNAHLSPMPVCKDCSSKSQRKRRSKQLVCDSDAQHKLKI